MKFKEASKLMKTGKALMSEVSRAVYEINDKGMLLAEGTMINEKYLTDKEMDGEWIEVRIVVTNGDFDKLSDDEIENILHGAYERFKFDMANRK